MMEDGNPNGFYVLKFNNVELIPEFIPFPSGSDGTNRLRIMLDPPMTLSEVNGIHRGSLQAGQSLLLIFLMAGSETQ